MIINMMFLFCCLGMVDGFIFDTVFKIKYIPDSVLCQIKDLPENINNVVDTTDTFIHKFFNVFPSEFNYNLFLKVTKKLPELHAVGDKILIENEKIISTILESDISNELKKKIIGIVIDLTISGDHIASDILSYYRDLVNHIL